MKTNSKSAPRPPSDDPPRNNFKIYQTGRTAPPPPDAFVIHQDIGNAPPKFLRSSQHYVPLFWHVANDIYLPLSVTTTPLASPDPKECPIKAIEPPPCGSDYPTNGTLCPQCSYCEAWLSPICFKPRLNHSTDCGVAEIKCLMCDKRSAIQRNKSWGTKQPSDDLIEMSLDRSFSQSAGVIEFNVGSREGEPLIEIRHVVVLIFEMSPNASTSAIEALYNQSDYYDTNSYLMICTLRRTSLNEDDSIITKRPCL